MQAQRGHQRREVFGGPGQAAARFDGVPRARSLLQRGGAGLQLIRPQAGSKSLQGVGLPCRVVPLPRRQQGLDGHREFGKVARKVPQQLRIERRIPACVVQSRTNIEVDDLR